MPKKRKLLTFNVDLDKASFLFTAKFKKLISYFSLGDITIRLICQNELTVGNINLIKLILKEFGQISKIYVTAHKFNSEIKNFLISNGVIVSSNNAKFFYLFNDKFEVEEKDKFDEDYFKDNFQCCYRNHRIAYYGKNNWRIGCKFLPDLFPIFDSIPCKECNFERCNSFFLKKN